jgi:2-(1,2-epoxy-1,2-dihydrophenyl)acetyl-CoA isomerase
VATSDEGDLEHGGPAATPPIADGVSSRVVKVEVDTGTGTVRSWIAGGVGVIELNRPERRNALHEDMYDAVPRLIERFEADDAVGCLLITGAGTAFCAGGDVQAGVERSKRGQGRYPEQGDPDNPLLGMARMVLMLHESPKISIAALPGPAVGAGIGIALAADLRIAATSASLIPGWGRLAFSGDFGGAWFLTRMLGAGRALAVLVDNAPISSAQGERLGIFNRVVPDSELDDAAMSWAAAIAAGPQTAYQYMKENVRDAQQLSLRDALPRESDRMRASGQTEEHRQAVKRWLREARAKNQT